MEEINPKVFISYSHDSKEHQDRVLKLSDKLRSEGIDCALDQYEDSPPEGWPKWMDRNVRNSDYVLVVCTETYYKRVMGTVEKGMGIKWESSLIYQQLYNAGANNTKFIPIYFNDGKFEHIPEPLQGATFYNVEDSDSYDKLYWRLRGVKTQKPELGKLRVLPEKERKTLFISGFINVELWDKAGWKGVAFLHDYAFKEPSSMGILFTDKEMATKIFQGWEKRLGKEDEFNELRISFVEGDVPGEPFGYYVHINSYPQNIVKRFKSNDVNFNVGVDLMMLVSRIHRMNPSRDSKNLQEFKDRFNHFKSYSLIPCVLHNGNKIEVIEGLEIIKKDVEFRKYTDIKSRNDLDSVLNKKYVSEI